MSLKTIGFAFFAAAATACAFWSLSVVAEAAQSGGLGFAALPQATPTPTPTPGSVGGYGPGHGGTISPPRTDVYNQSQVTQKARLLTKPAPVYTKTAAEKLITGTVRLRAILSSSGKVTEIRPLSALPEGLTDAAVAAARKITFEPAIKDGKPVSQWVTLEYHFRLYPDADDPSLETSARILQKPEPEYTDLAREHKISGKVVLDLGLLPDGTVQVDKVVEGLPDGLTEAAVEAAKKIRFVPAVYKDGRISAQYYRVEYTFKP